MKNLSLVSFVLAASVLSACTNMKQDPTTDHKDVISTSVPDSAPADDKKPIQTTLPTIYQEPPPIQAPVQPTAPAKSTEESLAKMPFNIDIPDSMNFVEGFSSEFQIKVRLSFQNVDVDLQGVNLPEGMQLTDVSTPDQPRLWKLEWKPSYGVVSADSYERQYNGQLRLVVKKADDAKVADIFKLVPKEVSFKFVVRRTQKPPTFVNIPEQLQLTEGDVLPFSIEVEDLASYDSYKPILKTDYTSTGQLLTHSERDARFYVRPGQPDKESLGNGHWKFNFVVDTKNAPMMAQLDQQGQNVIDSEWLYTRLSLSVVSQTGASSPEKTLRIQIKYVNRPQVPVFKVDANSLKLQAGQSNVLKVQVYAPIGKGQVGVTSTTVDGWTGDLKPQCVTTDNPAVVNCEIPWSIPCDIDLKTAYTLDMQATHTLGDKSHDGSLSKALKITACGANKPAIKTASKKVGGQ